MLEFDTDDLPEHIEYIDALDASEQFLKRKAAPMVADRLVEEFQKIKYTEEPE